MRDAVVTVPICPLFLEPREGSELADEVLYGMVVTVLGEEKGWLRFRTRYRYEGFARPGALGERDALAWEVEARSVVIRPFADVLSAPRVPQLGACDPSPGGGARRRSRCRGGRRVALRHPGGRKGGFRPGLCAAPGSELERGGRGVHPATSRGGCPRLPGDPVSLGREDSSGDRLLRPLLHDVSSQRTRHLPRRLHQGGFPRAPRRRRGRSDGRSPLLARAHRSLPRRRTVRALHGQVRRRPGKFPSSEGSGLPGRSGARHHRLGERFLTVFGETCPNTSPGRSGISAMRRNVSGRRRDERPEVFPGLLPDVVGNVRVRVRNLNRPVQSVLRDASSFFVRRHGCFRNSF